MYIMPNLYMQVNGELWRNYAGKLANDENAKRRTTRYI